MKRGDDKSAAASEPPPSKSHPSMSDPKELEELRAKHAALLEERDRLRAEIGQLQERGLRARADYDNLVKRTSKESQDAIRYVKSGLLLRVANLVETMEALGHDLEKRLGGDAKGFKLVLDEAKRLLKDEGVKEIPGKGQPFNYRYHQAVERVETSEHKEGTIVEVVHRGYQLGEDILRPALVKVAAPPKPS
jgi:molecular chaperone GrpE